MAEVDAAKISTPSEQYLLKKDDKKLDLGTKPAEELEEKNTAAATSDKVVDPKTEESPVVDGSDEGNPAASAESNEASPSAEKSASEATESAEESGSSEQEDSGDQEDEQTPEIKIETAPADFRFPTTNQTRHCFTCYIEYHRCVAAKGEDAPECDKFAKYYRSLCPGEWIDRWNEQRENGTFPGPL